MTKEELYKSCNEIDVTDCEQIVDKINEITVAENFTDEQKLFAINIILNKNLNKYISNLKNENCQLKLRENEQASKLRNMETKYREHLEHSHKEIETLNRIIQDMNHIHRNYTKPVKRFVVKTNNRKN
jgi:hypothetical protein